MRKWLPLVTVCLGTLMLLIDVTIVNVALPDMAANLKTSFSSLQWVVDGYALALAALLLGVGAIADRVGHRISYIAGLAVFALSSLACGLAGNTDLLIAARVVQGVGAAAMFATTFALLNSSYAGKDRGIAYGMWGAVAGASSAIGPLVGGPLTQGLSWRWIFFVNLPVSVIAIVMCLTVLRDSQTPEKRRVDVGGLVVFTAASAALTYGMIRATEVGWADVTSWGTLVLGLVLLGAFALVESRVTDPLLDLGLLRSRVFSGVLLASLVLSFAAFSSFAYTSIWLQSVLGLGPVKAGLIGLPLSAAAFAVSAGVGRFLHGGRSAGWAIGGGLALIGVGDLIAFAMVRGDASWPALLPGFFVIGLGVGLATPVLSSTGMAAVPPQRGGMAAGAVNTGRQLGFAFGIALLGSVFSVGAERSLRDDSVPQAARAAHAIAGGQSGQLLRAAPEQVRGQVADAIKAAAVGGVHEMFIVGGALGILTGLLVFLLLRPGRPEAGSDATGEPATEEAATVG